MVLHKWEQKNKNNNFSRVPSFYFYSSSSYNNNKNNWRDQFGLGRWAGYEGHDQNLDGN